VKIDVSGATPWLGVDRDWSNYRILVEGEPRTSRWGLHDGEVAIDEDGAYLFGFSRPETPSGHPSRKVPYELVLRRVTIGRDDGPAQLILHVRSDRIQLDLNGERRQGRLHELLRALPLVEGMPETGRPVGSLQREDTAALQAELDSEAARLKQRRMKVSIRSLATSMGYDETALGRKIRRLGLTVPR